MNRESGFLGGNDNPLDVGEIELFADFKPLSTSKSGFFRVLIGSHLGRKVVLKTLKEEAARNPVAIAQLNKEYNTVFTIDSPNVVRAFRLTKLKDDVPAFEMEWCGGSNVRTLLAEKLTREDAIEILRGIMAGLRDIHNAGIIHRDIKPENVIYDSYRKVVKIIDFGAAYVTGSLMLQGPDGTENYTPDVKMALGSEAEPRDDLYALGVMTAEIAQNLSVQSKKDIGFKKSLTKFSDRLMAGSFQKAGEAALAFEETIKEKKRLRMPILVALAALLICMPFIISRFRHKPSTTILPSAVSDSVATEILDHRKSVEIEPEESPKEVVTAPEPPTVPAPVPAPTPTEIPTPTPDIVDDGKIYELAIMAGPLLQAAKSKSATLQTRMDAFVINFTDSIYRAEDLWSKYPQNMVEDDMRQSARQLAQSHLDQMEQEFGRNFGTIGDAHRRAVLMEGRFYCSFLVYHRTY